MSIIGLKILIVDDHPAFNNGLKYILEAICPSAIFLMADSVQQAKELFETNSNIQWVFLDNDLPDGTGFDIVQYLNGKFSTAAIILVSASEAPKVVYKYLSHGVSGFIPKDSELDEYKKCFAQVNAGETYVAEHFLETLLQYESVELSEEKAIRASLTDRQLEVLTLMAEGYTNPEISDALDISVNTVKNHINVIMKVFNAGNRTECAASARRLGLALA